MRKVVKKMNNSDGIIVGNRNSSSGGGTAATTTTPCCSKIGLKRGPWTPEEDQVLSNYIRKEGEGRWRTLPKRAGLLRCGKSCRLRWMNYLRPSVKRGQIAPDEEDLILRLHRLLGNRWSLIAGRIPGRTDNEIKNYWNTHLSKKLISQGIDPRTHKPLINSSSSTAPPPPPPPLSNHSSKLPPPPPTSNNNPPHFNQDQFDDQFHSIASYVDNDHHLPITSNSPLIVPAMDDVSKAIRINGNEIEEDNNYEHDMINYCSDDVFSSFLNSLINEDAFATPHHEHEHHPTMISNSDNPLMTSPSAPPPPPPPPYGIGSLVWDSVPLVSSSTFTQNHDPCINPDTVGHRE